MATKVLANRKKLTDEMLNRLPDEVRESLQEKIANAEVDSDNLCLKRTQYVGDFNTKAAHAVGDFEIEKGETQTAIGYSSTREVDRDHEIVVPNGGDLRDYKKAGAVKMFNHDWTGLPVGKNLRIKSDGFGIAHKTKYGGNDFANDVFSTMQFGSLKTSSIGFIPLKILWNGTNDFNKFIDKAIEAWDEFESKTADSVYAIISKWALLEDSIVGVPANPGAVTTAVSNKSLTIHLKSLERMGFDVTDIVEDEFTSLVTAQKRLIVFDEASEIEAEEHEKKTKSAQKVDKEPEEDNILVSDLDLSGLKRYGIPNVGKSVLSPEQAAQVVTNEFDLMRGKI